MAIPQPPPAFEDSLLAALLATGTLLDFDGQDAQQIAMFPPGSFRGATSNQAIVRFELLKDHHKSYVAEAVREAQQLVEDEIEGAKNRDPASVAVDILSIKFALPILPLLRPEGFVHCQTAPSAAYSVEKTLAHAHNLIALYRHYGVPASRLTVKIPATLQGLQACAELVKESHNVLATVVYVIEQALAAGAAGQNGPGRCLHAAAYVAPLAWNFDPDNLHVEHGLHGLPGFKVLAEGQKSFKERGWSHCTMQAASLITIPEAISVAGCSSATVSPRLLSILAQTHMTPDLASQIAASTEVYARAAPSELNCDISTPEGLETVTKALEAPETKTALQESVAIFGRFEMELLALTQAESRRAGDA